MAPLPVGTAQQLRCNRAHSKLSGRDRRKLPRGGDGHIVVYGGFSFWQSPMRLDLIDVFYLSLYPYVAGKGRRLFDDVGNCGPLDLVSSMTTGSSA